MKAASRHVCSHNTGHAEVVHVEFDPNEVSYEDLVDVFWSIHNPTTKNRQGWDIGLSASGSDLIVLGIRMK